MNPPTVELWGLTQYLLTSRVIRTLTRGIKVLLLVPGIPETPAERMRAVGFNRRPQLCSE